MHIYIYAFIAYLKQNKAILHVLTPSWEGQIEHILLLGPHTIFEGCNIICLNSGSE
jgi:hypothetical protein